MTDTARQAVDRHTDAMFNQLECYAVALENQDKRDESIPVVPEGSVYPEGVSCKITRDTTIYAVRHGELLTKVAMDYREGTVVRMTMQHGEGGNMLWEKVLWEKTA